jgi:hypothetical protein
LASQPAEAGFLRSLPMTANAGHLPTVMRGSRALPIQRRADGDHRLLRLEAIRHRRTDRLDRPIRV